jgi:predicted DsbA family dithiol-disulfide isomerase
MGGGSVDNPGAGAMIPEAERQAQKSEDSMRIKVFFLTLVAVFSLAASASAADWTLFQNLAPGEPPVDVAVSRDGQWIYVLSDSGTVFIYSPGGELKDRVNVGPGVDRIEAGLRDDLVYVSNRKDGTVKMLRIEMVHDIPISGAPFKGPAGAPVTIVVFTDFECPYCAKAAQLLEEVVAAHPKSVKLVFKAFPLRSHANAQQAAAAALAADRHGKFWEFHDRLFADFNRLSPQKIREIAVSLGFQEEEFVKEMAAPEILARIQQDLNDGREAGVRGTPSIFVNGRLLRERSISGMEAAIARELSRDGS